MSAARADETNKRTNERCAREPGESDARVMFGGGGGGGGDGTNPFGRPTPTPTPGGANPFAASANGGGDGNGNLVGTPFGRATTTPASPFGQPSTSATPFGQPSTSASTPFGQPSTSTPFGSTSFGAFGGRGRERGRGVVAVRAAELGGGGVVAVRASERRSVAVRTERGVVVAVRSDEWCVRFDVRVAVRRRIELAFRRERADADSVRNDDVGARRCEPVRVWWHRGGVAIWIFERAERADEFTVRRCAPNRRRGVAVFGQARRARDTSVGRWF